MTNANTAPQIGRPPADSTLIRFDSDCFETVGLREVYFVIRSALHSGPEKFTDRAAAEAFARRSGRTVDVSSEPIRRRVKWY
jgi:hypothetical protein